MIQNVGFASRTLRNKILIPFLLLTCLRPLAAQESLLPVFHFNRLTTAEGLPSNEIRSNVVRDRSGFIWIGTQNGLARYDGYTCRVYRELATPNNPVVLFIDSKERLWIGKYANGLSLYDPASDQCVNLPVLNRGGNALRSSYIQTIFEDQEGVVWAATLDGVISLDLGDTIGETNADSVARHIKIRTILVDGFRDGASKIERWDDSSIVVASFGGLFVVNRFSGSVSRPRLPPAAGISVETAAVAALFRESNSKLWIGTVSHGLYLLDQTDGRLTYYPSRTKDDPVQELQMDGRGRLWIMTGNRLELFNPAMGSREEYLSSSGAPGKSMWSRLALDSTGTLWISTGDDGLYYLSPASFRFPHYALRGQSGGPVRMETINRWSDGSCWVGAEGKVVQVRAEDLGVLSTVDVFKGRGSTYGPSFWASYNDGTGTLWLGTWGLGLYGFRPETGQVRNYFPSSQLPRLIARENVCRSIVGTGSDTLWIASHNDKLLSFDSRHGTFASAPYDVTGQVVHLMGDRTGKIWVSDEMLGLFVFDPTTQRSHHIENISRGLDSSGTIHPQRTFQDPEGRIWMGSDNAYLWKPDTRSFRPIRNDRFADATLVLPLGNDGLGRVWFIYEGKGLGILDPKTETFSNFDFSDGLFYYRSMTSLDDGRVILCGDKGMTVVHPESLYAPGRTPPLVISRVSVNDSVNVPAMSLARSGLRLPHDQNVLEFEFAAIDPGQGHLIEYRYMLEGLEKTWVRPAGRRFVRYPGLAPRDYLFRVRAMSILGRWPDQEASLIVTIEPPWWRTWWAYGLYAILLVGIASSAYRLRIRQLSLRQRAEHLAEVDRIKSRFFANISHEFRTPLTLILGPIERIRSQTETESVLNDLTMMQRNAHNLLRLINQLLDLSKLEVGAMQLRAARMNIVPFVKGLAYSLETSARTRRIGLEVVAASEEIEVYCDSDMLEKIITNLLSNALKFTPPGGKVTVQISDVVARDSGVRSPKTVPHTLSNGRVAITVSDTGVGIPPDQIERIFDRFYQVDDSHTRKQQGSGIGLALVKELVELHRGIVEARSESGRGSTFTVLLPLGRAHLREDEIVDAAAPREPRAQESLAIPAGESDRVPEEAGPLPKEADQKPIVLVIEDNRDVRAYIKSYLATLYQVQEAGDGAEGMQKAFASVPDVVISDVMMPKKDGFEVCRTLKFDERTSHIPVILLTAKAAGEDRIEGLETGADDYLVKPFEPRELLARIRNLIDQRRKLRERFSAGQVLKPGEITVSSIDEVFLQKVKGIVEAHISEEGFGPEDLSREVAMSRSQVHRKLTAITGMAAGDFIRYLRLHRAMNLLSQNAATVAEISYMVGFSTPSHFTKCFHELFGTTPAEVRRIGQ